MGYLRIYQAHYVFIYQYIKKHVQNTPRDWAACAVSKVGLSFMGDTAVQYTDCYLSPCQHDI